MESFTINWFLFMELFFGTFFVMFLRRDDVVQNGAVDLQRLLNQFDPWDTGYKETCYTGAHTILRMDLSNHTHPDIPEADCNELFRRVSYVYQFCYDKRMKGFTCNIKDRRGFHAFCGMHFGTRKPLAVVIRASTGDIAFRNTGQDFVIPRFWIPFDSTIYERLQIVLFFDDDFSKSAIEVAVTFGNFSIDPLVFAHHVIRVPVHLRCTACNKLHYLYFADGIMAFVKIPWSLNHKFVLA